MYLVHRDSKFLSRIRLKYVITYRLFVKLTHDRRKSLFRRLLIGWRIVHLSLKLKIFVQVCNSFQSRPVLKALKLWNFKAVNFLT